MFKKWKKSKRQQDFRKKRKSFVYTEIKIGLSIRVFFKRRGKNGLLTGLLGMILKIIQGLTN